MIQDLEEWPEEPLNARARFWLCSDHRKGSVEWRGDVAYCLEPGCGKTSAADHLAACGCLINRADAHRVGCPEFPEGRPNWPGAAVVALVTEESAKES